MAGSGRFSRNCGVLSLTLGVLLGGCSGGLFSKGPPPAFDLTAPHFARGPGAGRGQLVVAEPTGVSILDTEKVVVRTDDGSVSQLPGVQWSDRLPRLVQARLIETFENGRRLRVGRPGERLAADYQMLTDLRAFQISVSNNQVGADVEIAVKVVADRSGRIVAANVFRAFVPISSIDNDGMAALDQAFRRVASDIVTWAARRV